MTDEELGRDWAAKHGKAPTSGKEWRSVPPCPKRWYWHSHHHVYDNRINKSIDSYIPSVIAKYFIRESCTNSTHNSESEAYAVLGAAIRRVVEELRVIEELKEMRL